MSTKSPYKCQLDDNDAIVTGEPNCALTPAQRKCALANLGIEGAGSVEPATATKLGGVKVGSGLAVTSDGTLSASGGNTIKTHAVDESDYDLFTAGASVGDLVYVCQGSPAITTLKYNGTSLSASETSSCGRFGIISDILPEVPVVQVSFNGGVTTYDVG